MEQDAYHGAAKGLAGMDLGRDVKAWVKFWHENGDRLLREGEERYAARASARHAR